jgi:hypothetical protein
MPGTADTVIWGPENECSYHSKYVEQFTNINKLYIVASYWTIIDKNMLIGIRLLLIKANVAFEIY